MPGKEKKGGIRKNKINVPRVREIFDADNTGEKQSGIFDNVIPEQKQFTISGMLDEDYETTHVEERGFAETSEDSTDTDLELESDSNFITGTKDEVILTPTEPEHELNKLKNRIDSLNKAVEDDWKELGNVRKLTRINKKDGLDYHEDAVRSIDELTAHVNQHITRFDRMFDKLALDLQKVRKEVKVRKVKKSEKMKITDVEKIDVGTLVSRVDLKINIAEMLLEKMPEMRNKVCDVLFQLMTEI